MSSKTSPAVYRSTAPGSPRPLALSCGHSPSRSQARPAVISFQHIYRGWLARAEQAGQLRLGSFIAARVLLGQTSAIRIAQREMPAGIEALRALQGAGLLRYAKQGAAY